MVIIIVIFIFYVTGFVSFLPQWGHCWCQNIGIPAGEIQTRHTGKITYRSAA